jgi:type II secretory pathway component GspD/PulD (secretin)
LADAAGRLGIGPVEIAADVGRSRLLLAGSDDDVALAAEAVGYLDVPRPAAEVSVGVYETSSAGRSERGGRLAFDRDGVAGAPDTVLRGFSLDFEPESFLRSKVVSARAFEGSSVALGSRSSGGFLAGASEAVLRALAREGSATALAEPTLVVTEGEPAYLESSFLVPLAAYTQSGAVLTYGPGPVEKAGLRLEVVAERIGVDSVTLRFRPWLRSVVESRGEASPERAPVLAVREVDTRLTLPDGRVAVVGGLSVVRRTDVGWGPAALDPLAGFLRARGTECETRDVVFAVRVRIRTPGRSASPVVPPGEAARLSRRTRARVVAVEPSPAGGHGLRGDASSR